MKHTIDHSRRQTQVKAIYFNRYLLIRYVTALFFFIHLYWGLLSCIRPSCWTILPFLLVVVDIIILFEQTIRYWRPSNYLPLTKIGYMLHIGSYLSILLLFWFIPQALFFSLDSQERSYIGTLFLLVGCLLSLLIEQKVHQIERNQDSYLKLNTILAESMERNGEKNEQ